MKQHRIRIMPMLAAALLGSFSGNPAFAALGTPLRKAAPAAAASAPALGASAKRIKQQEQEQRNRRATAYRAWFYRKYGLYPTAAQFRDWHYRSYGVYPS